MSSRDVVGTLAWALKDSYKVKRELYIMISRGVNQTLLTIYPILIIFDKVNIN